MGSYRQKLLVLYAILVFVFVISLLIGRYPKPGFLSLSSILHDQIAGKLLINLRLPRVISAMLLGISLSLAGLIMQTAFQNPLVDPGFLGVSQGAAFGAAFAIIFLNSFHYAIQIFAIIFGIIGLILSYWVSSKVRFGGQVLRLILSGIAVSALFSAGVGISFILSWCRYLKIHGRPYSAIARYCILALRWIMGSQMD